MIHPLCACGKCDKRLCCRKQRLPRLLPFKKGDHIVVCPNKSSCGDRGRTGEILFVANHLEVGVSLDDGVSPFRRTEKGQALTLKTYMVRHAEECHECQNRMGHMQGAYCPADHKEVVFYEKEKEADTEAL